MSISFFFFKQNTAYELRISDWSSYVCSSDLKEDHPFIRSGETDDFMAADHIVVSTKGMAHAHRAVERALLEKIHPDRIRIVASSFLVALAACFESDLILTAPARVIGRLAEVYGLRAVRPPIDRKGTRLNSSH